MGIITQEHLASNFIKSVLRELHDEFTNDKKAHENCVTFDEYVWNRINELGYATYHAIGEHYGDLDSAVNEVME